MNHLKGLDEKEYKRRIRAWTMYDWANSAFATTILAAVLPVYYSQVAGATLPSEATATQYWSYGLIISTLVIAVLSPILGTVSDVMRGKKAFLSIFAGIGVLATGLLVLVSTGDWMLASLLFVFGRIGFNGSIVFYDALLPHVARPEDQDMVSARGYAIGYLGGGLLLVVNVVMIFLMPGTWGSRLSFLSVAIWWAIFSIPVLRHVPEPPSATEKLLPGQNVLGVSLKRLVETFKNLRQYRELFKFLVAYLIYIDGVGTIIDMATIYGAELGFGSIELILALALVQFVGMPYSLVFGRLPSANEKRRPFFMAVVVLNIFTLPFFGIAGRLLLPADVTGVSLPPYEATVDALGQGRYLADQALVTYAGLWSIESIPPQPGEDTASTYRISQAAGDQITIPFNGQRLELIYATGPDYGTWEVTLDGEPLLDEDGAVVTVDAYRDTLRYGMVTTLRADQPGKHILTLTISPQTNPKSQGTRMALAGVEVMVPERVTNLGIIFGAVLLNQLLTLGLAWLLAVPVFSRFTHLLDTRKSLLLALLVYSAISVWAFFLDSAVEYWFLAWMVATVQGGSQALSRSLFASMSPASKSGEFFGLFAIMEKFTSLLGPILFAISATLYNSSRPAILGIIVFFFLGGYLLTRVNTQEGQRVAREEDARYFSPNNA
ncbi:MAG: MFS transporter [Anaerolineales bacterium]|jgi:UMF1 family MFS transporter|nr:MFS transporter [Anaerolineales bacterium]